MTNEEQKAILDACLPPETPDECARVWADIIKRTADAAGIEREGRYAEAAAFRFGALLQYRRLPDWSRDAMRQIDERWIEGNNLVLAKILRPDDARIPEQVTGVGAVEARPRHRSRIGLWMITLGFAFFVILIIAFMIMRGWTLRG